MLRTGLSNHERNWSTCLTLRQTQGERYIERRVRRTTLGHRINRFEEGEAMEVGVSGIDASNPMLAHQNSSVSVVYHVPSEVRQFPEYLGHDRGMPIRGEEEAETGRSQHSLNKFPRARRRPGLSEHSWMRCHPEEFV